MKDKVNKYKNNCQIKTFDEKRATCVYVSMYLFVCLFIFFVGFCLCSLCIIRMIYVLYLLIYAIIYNSFIETWLLLPRENHSCKPSASQWSSSCSFLHRLCVADEIRRHFISHLAYHGGTCNSQHRWKQSIPSHHGQHGAAVNISSQPLPVHSLTMSPPSFVMFPRLSLLTPCAGDLAESAWD